MLERICYSENMADKKRKQERGYDFAATAFWVVQGATGQLEPELKGTESALFEGKNPHAVALGRLGGLKGGKARFEKLTPQRRKEIAQKAAKTRWHGKGQG